MTGESGLQVIREIKSFRARDDLWCGLPYRPAIVVCAITALFVMYLDAWTAAAMFFFGVTIPAKLLAIREPYWLEQFPKFIAQMFNRIFDW